MKAEREAAETVAAIIMKAETEIDATVPITWRTIQQGVVPTMDEVIGAMAMVIGGPVATTTTGDQESGPNQTPTGIAGTATVPAGTRIRLTGSVKR